MLVASLMGAVAFQKGLGVNHSCAHALSTVFDTHHGLANGLMLKACMKFNYEAVPEKFERIAQAVGCATSQQFFSWLDQLLTEVELPSGLAALDITVTDRLVDVAQADVCHPLGPRAVSREDFFMLYNTSL